MTLVCLYWHLELRQALRGQGQGQVQELAGRQIQVEPALAIVGCGEAIPTRIGCLQPSHRRPWRPRSIQEIIHHQHNQIHSYLQLQHSLSCEQIMYLDMSSSAVSSCSIKRNTCTCRGTVVECVRVCVREFVSKTERRKHFKVQRVKLRLWS